MKKFQRDQKNKIISGTAAGIGNFFSIQPKFIRVVFLIATLYPPFFPSFVVYLIFWILMPVGSYSTRSKTNKKYDDDEIIDVEIK
jgi:phage shock protein PspC (stress-responsive transcriptional regulator)